MKIWLLKHEVEGAKEAYGSVKVLVSTKAPTWPGAVVTDWVEAETAEPPRSIRQQVIDHLEGLTDDEIVGLSFNDSVYRAGEQEFTIRTRRG